MTHFIAGLIGIAVSLGLALLAAFPVMWLWDTVMPELFGLKEISFIQSFCLILLSGILFNQHKEVNVTK